MESEKWRVKSGETERGEKEMEREREREREREIKGGEHHTNTQIINLFWHFIPELRDFH